MSSPAETYESVIVPAVFAQLAFSLVEYLEPAPGDRILDLACGTGIVARTVATTLDGNCSIVGLDPQPPMLTVAHRAAKQAGVNAEWVEGRAEQLPFPDRTFDLVLCQQGLQFAEDRGRAVEEMYRVLIPGGCAGIAVMQDIALHPFFVALASAIQRHLGVPVIDQPFSLSSARELETLFLDAKFKEVEIQPVVIQARFPEPDRYLESQIEIASIAVRSAWGLDQQRRGNLVAAIRSEMAPTLRDHTEGEHLVIPWHMHLARASC